MIPLFSSKMLKIMVVFYIDTHMHILNTFMNYTLHSKYGVVLSKFIFINSG